MKYLHIVWHGIVKVLTWLLVLPILFYQKCITPYTPPSCRFQPTCSEYAMLPYGLPGIFRAGWLKAA